MSALKPTPQIKNEGPSETTAYNETLLEMNMMPRGEAGGATGGAAVGHAEKAVFETASAEKSASEAAPADVLKDEEKEQAAARRKKETKVAKHTNDKTLDTGGA